MSPGAGELPPHAGTGSAQPAFGAARWLHRGENALVALALAVMVALPLAEIVLRTFFHSGLAGSDSMVQHLTLIVGMVGGMLAARDGRLLALSTLTAQLRGAWAKRAHGFSYTIAAAVATALTLAAADFVNVERTSAHARLAGLPLWTMQLVLPLGFAVIACRLWWQSADGWRGRLLAGAGAAGLLALGLWPPVAATTLAWPAWALLVVAAAFGAPVFVALGGAGLLLFWSHDLPLAAMPGEHYRLVVNPTLPSIPLFTLAGYFLAESGSSRRLIELFNALAGHVRGGPAVAVALVCAFFTAFTGASGVTILALGGLLMPVLRAARFSERDALGMMTGAGSLGILLPPCLPVIFYAMIAQVDIKTMFLGAFVPGVLLIALTAAWGLWAGRKAGTPAEVFDLGRARRAVWMAKWELFLPVVSLAALFGGWATPVEAAAVTAGYAFVVVAFIHRDLDLRRDGIRVMAEAGLLVGGILLILGVALGLTNYLVDTQVPGTLAAWSLAHVPSRWLFLLGLNVVLILVGGLVEIYAAIVVIVPLLVPVGAALGIDPVHLGVIFLANMELGFLAPPVGLNLLLSSSRLKVPLAEVTRAVLPLLLVMFLGVLLITYVPALTTALPKLLHAAQPLPTP